MSCNCSWWFHGCALAVRGSDLVGDVMRHGGARSLVAVGGSCGARSLGFVGFWSNSWVRTSSMVSPLVWLWVMGDCASMVPITLWFMGFLGYRSWLIWAWVVADLVDLVHGFFLAVGRG